MEKYDVFISCKSEDYEYAEKIYDFLADNCINAFLASRELRRLGEAEYRRAIINAMQQATHLIIFASNAEYIDSPWVFYEWDMFVTAKLKGYKSGNIITILKDVPNDKINFSLWVYESLPYKSYTDKIIDYVDTEAARIRRETKEQHRHKLSNQKRIELQNELSSLGKAFKKSLVSMSVDADRLYSIMSALGITTRRCPACRHKNELKASFCEACGWPMTPIDGIEDFEYLTVAPDDALGIYRSRLSAADNAVKQITAIRDKASVSNTETKQTTPATHALTSETKKKKSSANSN